MSLKALTNPFVIFLSLYVSVEGGNLHPVLESSYAKLISGDQAFEERRYDLAKKEYKKGLDLLSSDLTLNALLRKELQDRHKSITKRLEAETSSRHKLNHSKSRPLARKLKEMVIPKLELSQITLGESLARLRKFTEEHDDKGVLPQERGVSFVLNLNSPAVETQRFSLNLKNVSIDQVLKALCKVLPVQVSINKHAVVVSEIAPQGESLEVRHYTISPTKLLRHTNLALLEQKFGKKKSMLQSYSLQQLLESLGVSFCEGSSAAAIQASGKIIVNNTREQHQHIERLMQEMHKAREIMVRLEVKLISIQGNVQVSKELSASEVLVKAASDGVGALNISLEGNSFNTLPVDQTIDTLLQKGDALYDPLAVSNTQNVSGNAETFEQKLSQLTSNQNSIPGIISVTAGVNDQMLEILLGGLKQNKTVKFLMEPSLVTQSGQQTRLHLGREFRYPQRYTPPQISPGNSSGVEDDDLGSYTWREDYDADLSRINELYGKAELAANYTAAITPSHPNQFVTTLLGSELTITPTYKEGSKIINLSINLTHRELDGYIDYGSPIQTISRKVTFDREGIEAFLDSTPSPTSEEILESLNGGNNIEVEEYIFQSTPNRVLQPVFSKIKAQTNVSVYDGTTVILGGLLKTQAQTVKDKSSLLSKLPFVGKFFTSEVEQRIDKQIFIAIKASAETPKGVPLN